jgi:hypothetical protein
LPVAASSHGRTPLRTFASVFLLAALGVGSGDYFFVHDGGPYVSVVLGIACGLIVVCGIWGDDRRRGVR